MIQGGSISNFEDYGPKSNCAKFHAFNRSCTILSIKGELMDICMLIIIVQLDVKEYIAMKENV